MGDASDDPTLAAPGGEPGSRSVAKPDVALGRGTSIGRYVVLSRTGSGGMGVVYAAIDPELDRKVAIKLLHRSGDATAGTGANRRLVREARALAKLSHPNVVAIHDVGEHEGRVYLAMEFIAGHTLVHWLAAARRGWPDVLEAFEQAGQGLAAAHERGLVHLDFKPDNVMVDIAGDGRSELRVRVMDFGLARPSDARESWQETEDAPAVDMLGQALTADGPGAIAGTPAYMAPEQHLGLPAGPAADQFAFCVALWEALYGQRPFAGQTLTELAFNVTEGTRRPPPSGVGVPRWLQRVCDRGLAMDPALRFKDMGSLLAALRRWQTRARLRAVVAAAAVVGLLGVGVWGYSAVDRARQVRACEAEGSSIEEVWNDEERAKLRAGVLATGAAHAETTADHVVPWLDQHASAWATARTQACLDATVRNAWDKDTRQRSTWCLDDSAMQLQALVVRLQNADLRAVTLAVQGAAVIRQVPACRDPQWLRRLPEPPTRWREEIGAVRADLSRALALQATGAYEEGLGVAQECLRRAEELAWQPLIAVARIRVGTLLGRTGKHEDAEAMLESAFFEAAGAGASEDALTAAHTLGYTVGYRLARYADGERWLRLGELIAADLSDPTGLRTANGLEKLALLRSGTGAYAEAISLHERVLDLKEKALGADHPSVARTWSMLGLAHHELGHNEAAAEAHGRALEIQRSRLGPEHPHLATSLSNLAMTHRARGAYDRAAQLHIEALGIREKALGADHVDVAVSLLGLAGVRRETGKPQEAAVLLERALRIREDVQGPDHPHIAPLLGELGNAYRRLGDFEKAGDYLERGLKLREAKLGTDHPKVGVSLTNLANVRVEHGAFGEAVLLYGRALEIFEKKLGPDHPHVATTLSNLAEVGFETGALARAAARAERALQIREDQLGPEHPSVAGVLIALAQVRLATGALDDAERLYARALKIRETTPGLEPHLAAQPLVGLANVGLANGRDTAAIAHAQRAIKLLDSADVPPVGLAKARFVLARALHRTGNADRVRAIAFAEQAGDTFTNAGPRYAKPRADVEAWLSARHRSN